MRHPLSWILLHTLAIVLVVTSLLTGLRIATLSHPDLIRFSALLPEGFLHELHLVSGLALTAIAAGYLFVLILFHPHKHSDGFSRFIIWYGHAALLAVLVSGGLLYIGTASIVNIHFFAALAVMTYLLLHA